MPRVPRLRFAWCLVTVAALVGACGGSDEQLPPTGPDATPVDAPIDAAIDANAFCATCGADEICVQFFDGTCGQLSIGCEPRNAACAGSVCSPECMRYHCNQGNEMSFFRCDVGGCAGTAPGALHCYGP